MCPVWWIDSVLLRHFQYGRRQQQLLRQLAWAEGLAAADGSVRTQALKPIIKGALFRFGEDIQTQNFNIYNINNPEMFIYSIIE